MKFDRKTLALYAVTDRSWLRGAALSTQVEQCLKGGASIVQMREKDLNFEEFCTEAGIILEVCRKYSVPFIINDNLEVAERVGADGVHIGQDDTPVHKARKIIGRGKILGVSVSTPEQAVKAEREGADYLGAGAVFPTGTKTDAEYVPIPRLCEICDAVTIPAVAIGGITRDNIRELDGTGIAGVAVVSALFASDDIETAAREFVKTAVCYDRTKRRNI